MGIRSHNELETYNLAFQAAMNIFELTKKIPNEEKYSLTDQIRRSSKSVYANLAEAFRKRKYSKYFISKLSDCESEAVETQVWLQFSLECNCFDKNKYQAMVLTYDKILGKLVNMSLQPEKWSC
ncbi:MAG: four helix bundle protein [Bacteroidales bacterium]|nr:four helix bundle protein [Bacteroidales bacterium]